MDFTGPEAADLQDVRSLNAAFLDYLRGTPGAPLRAAMPAALRAAVAGLTDRQIERLAEAPFLLLSLRESDDAYWGRMLAEVPSGDLFAPASAAPLRAIAAATLGFLWQLARRNPYATRLVSGASLSWCERLADCTLLRLQRFADRDGLVGPRFPGDAGFWHRLLGAGLSSERNVRRAAQLCALQATLAIASTAGAQRFRSAACHSTLPLLELRGQTGTRR